MEKRKVIGFRGEPVRWKSYVSQLQRIRILFPLRRLLFRESGGFYSSRRVFSAVMRRRLFGARVSPKGREKVKFRLLDGESGLKPPPPSRAAFKRIRSIVKALGWDGEGVVGEITLGPRGAAQIQRLNFRRRITNTRTPATSYGPALGHSDSQHTITQIR